MELERTYLGTKLSSCPHQSGQVPQAGKHVGRGCVRDERRNGILLQVSIAHVRQTSLPLVKDGQTLQEWLQCNTNLSKKNNTSVKVND